MAYEIQYGNPNDTFRCREEQESYAFLDRLGILYRRVDHEAAFTIEACAAVDEVLGFSICKNLFLRNSNGSQYYLLLMPGDKPFKTKELSAQIMSTRLSFGDADKMQEMLSLTPGSVTVLGLLFDSNKRVELLIDRDLLDGEEFGCHPCMNTSTVAFSTKDLLEKILPALGRTPRFVELRGS